MTLWNNFINRTPCNGTYNFKDLRVKSYHGKYLTSTSMSVIQPSTSIQLAEKEVGPDVNAEDVVRFPPIVIDTLEEFYSCVKCHGKAIAEGQLLICWKCSAKSFIDKDGKRLLMKATFKLNETNIKLTIPHKVLSSFVQQIGLSENATLNEIEMGVLKSQNYVVHYSGFKANKILKD